jgi:aldose sugar dehydrogenase
MIPVRVFAGVLTVGGVAGVLAAGPFALQAPARPFVEDPHGQVVHTEKHAVRVEVVASGLETPWALAFLPDGRLLVTERPGRLRVLTNGQLSPPVKGIPAVHEQQDGGMFDVEVHPSYAKNGWIYLAYSEVLPGFTPPPPPPVPPPAPEAGRGRGRGRGPAIPSMTVVARGRISPSLEWTDHQVLVRASPDLYTTSGAHFGLRFAFDRQGRLFYTIGDRGVMSAAQDLASPLGKIHRVNDDGSAAADNPFAGRAGALATIWSYGHRNPQGLAWEPGTGRLWSSEHGPNGGDEVNVILPGHNYGWPTVSMGMQGGVTTGSAPGMDDPVVSFTPSIGPSGMTFYTGDRFPGWRGTSLFLSGLVGQQLLRFEVADGKVARQEVLFNHFGRVRDVVQGPDGYLYVLLQNPTGAGTGVGLSASTPGRLIRLVEAP